MTKEKEMKMTRRKLLTTMATAAAGVAVGYTAKATSIEEVMAQEDVSAELMQQGGWKKLESELGNKTDPLKGASLIGYNGGTVAEMLGTLLYTGGTSYAEVQAALDEAEGKTIRFAPGTYHFTDGTPIIRSGTRLIAEGEVIIVQPNPGAYSGFAVEPGSRNIVIEGFNIRGPWYQTGVPDWVNGEQDVNIWNTQYAENIGIDIRGRWYQREKLGYTLAQMQALTDVSENITIRNCQIEGFGQSGIFADNVTNLLIELNEIRKCGRDGIRMYGVVDSKCVDNKIKRLSPGFAGAKPNYNVYGITVTRLHGSSNIPDPLLQIGRCSDNVAVVRNQIEEAATWKSLDTHGGTNIRFIGNIVRGSYIGIGIDEGGSNDVNGKAPPRNITCVGNQILYEPSHPYRRAAILAFAPSAADDLIGRNLIITDNYIQGYGFQPNDGAISVSFFENVSISGNIFKDSLRCALALRNTVTDFVFMGNVVDNVIKTEYDAAYGVLAGTPNISGIIDGNVFRCREQEGLNAGILLPNPSDGFGVKVGKENVFIGPMNVKVNSSTSEAGGSWFLTPAAYGNIDIINGEAVLTNSKGIASVTKVDEGVFELFLSDSLSSPVNMVPQVTLKGDTTLVGSIVTNTAGSFRVRMTDLSGVLQDAAGFFVTVMGN